MDPNFFEIVEFSEILMLRRKIYEILLLVQTKVSNFIGKSSTWPPYSTGATTPLLTQNLVNK